MRCETIMKLNKKKEKRLSIFIDKILPFNYNITLHKNLDIIDFELYKNKNFKIEFHKQQNHNVFFSTSNYCSVLKNVLS